MSASRSIVPFGNWFDRVRVRATPATEAIGLAGRVGQVYGETVPSSSGVGREEIVGNPTEDYAVNVHFADLNKDVWFARDLLEFVDHAPGTEITVGQTKRIRTATGEWIETPTAPTAQVASNAKRDNRTVKIILWTVAAIFMIIVLASIIKRL